MKTRLKLGIAGFGVTGQALVQYLAEKSKHELIISDPLKNINGDLSQCNVVFICVPVPTNPTQDLTNVHDVIRKCSDDSIIVIRSTVLPETTATLAKTLDMDIIHIPEFLTARRAAQDQFDLKNMFIGINEIDGAYSKLFSSIFPDKKIKFINSTEAELIKYGHNCFGALKVTYFNAINEACEKMNISYSTVQDGILSSTGFINSEHTKIALDGKKGYGGTCFPNNIQGATTLKKCFGFQLFATLTQQLNNIYRWSDDKKSRGEP